MTGSFNYNPKLRPQTEQVNQTGMNHVKENQLRYKWQHNTLILLKLHGETRFTIDLYFFLNKIKKHDREMLKVMTGIQ